MKIWKIIKQEFLSLEMSRKEKAFVVTLLIMLSITIAFIIVRISNKPEEIWVEIPSAEQIEDFLASQETPKEKEEGQEIPTDNTNITTRAYNEADPSIQNVEKLKTLDELLAEQEAQNENGENTPQGENEPKTKTEPYKVDDGLSFKDLEKYKPASKDEKKANKRTLISYSLIGRKAISELPNPIYTCEQSGTIVVNIIVNAQGFVIEATYNKAGSSTSNGCLIDNAIYYARKARFNKSDQNNQIGTITYQFQ